jgi:hypothetical protein
MQCRAGLDSTNHLGADCRIMDVCADVNLGEDGHDVEYKSVAHSIYHRTVNLHDNEDRPGVRRTDEKIWDEF